MQKWSLENPSLMAQAGLMAQAAPVALRESSSLGADEHINSEFLGVEYGRKKLSKRAKKEMKARGGKIINGVPHVPMHFPQAYPPQFTHRGQGYPQAYAGSFPPGYYPGARGYGPAHSNQRPNQSHPAQQQRPQKNHETLTHELSQKFESYKKAINSEKSHLYSAFDAIDASVLIKAKAVAQLHNVFATFEEQSGHDEDEKWNIHVKSVNTNLVQFGRGNVSMNIIQHDDVKSPDFVNLPIDLARVWGYGYLIKEIIIVTEKHIRKMFPGAEIKSKAYYAHIQSISTSLRKHRSDIQTTLDELKRLLKTTVSPTNPVRVVNPVFRTTISGNRVQIQKPSYR